VKKLLPQFLYEETKENHDESKVSKAGTNRDPNQVPPKYSNTVLPSKWLKW
jgi:hypothetical protein